MPTYAKLDTCIDFGLLYHIKLNQANYFHYSLCLIQLFLHTFTKVYVHDSFIQHMVTFRCLFSDKPYVIKDGRELYAEQHGNLSISVRFYSYQLIKKITWIKIIKEKKTPLVSGDKYDTSITSETIRVPFYTKNINLQGKRSQLHIKDVDVVDYAEYEVHIENSFSEEIVRLVLKPEGML